MADGRWRPLEDVRVGDGIYGTVREGAYRRYAVTYVLDRWPTRKAAYRVTLEDGTELITSGDHRFLSGRGKWKHVVGHEQGRLRRPHLTLNDELMGVGAFASQPPHDAEYRRGYLCGIIRGDGHVGSYSYDRPGRTRGDVHRFRLALTDLEALRRARNFLREEGVKTHEFAFSAATGDHRAVRAIRTSAADRVRAIREVIEWPRQASDAWCKGFLAGIFDAEGGCTDALRIHNTNPAIIDWTTWCMRRFGFSYVIERARANGCRTVRIRGGLRERLRFFHATDPAITRKRTLEGMAVKSDAKLGIASIEPLDMTLPLWDITTGTGDFVANGVISHNCFARPTHKFLDFNAGRDFEREIVVKVNVPELLRKELAKPSWRREHVALGTNTDPYQWVEGRYKLMPGIWEAFRDFANPCSVLTKSPLLLRDLPLMQEVAERTTITANLSIPTLDEKVWRETEPHTPHPRKRIEAVAELNRAGIPTGVLVAPLIPGVNDAPEQIEPLLELLDEAGAIHIGGIALHLRGEVRDIWFDWLRSKRPDLVPRYEKLYARGAYAPPAERERLSRLVGSSTVNRRRYLRDRVNLGGAPEPAPAPRRKAVEQPSLF